MKLLIINNIKSGLQDGAIFDFIRLVSQDGDEACLRTTDGATRIESLLHDAQDFDAVVVSGGDGSIAAAAYALANTHVPLLPYPAGTANLLAENLSSPLEPNSLAKLLKSGRYLDFDLGEITARDQTFGFCIMAGAGYDATIMNGAKPNKKLLGPMAYFQAAFSNPSPQVSKIALEIDGKRHESEGLGILLVNFSKIQFDITVTHDNLPRDGLFDIVILKAENAFGLIPAVLAGIRDREGYYPDRGESLEIFRGREVHVECDPPMHIEYDGDLPGLDTPFFARALPQAARFIVSEEAYREFAE